jgi:hypothetical protein
MAAMRLGRPALFLAFWLMFFSNPIVLADPLPGATLGSSPDAFEQQLGPHNDHSDVAKGVLHFGQCPNTNTDELIVSFASDAAELILRQGCGLSRSTPELLADATTFMPTDTKLPGQPFRTSDGDLAEVFVSPSLATAMDADSFSDCDGHAVVPGSFSLLSIDNSDWVLGVGQCP